MKGRQHPHLRQASTLLSTWWFKQNGLERGRQLPPPILHLLVQLLPTTTTTTSSSSSTGHYHLPSQVRAERATQDLGQEEDHPVRQTHVVVLLERARAEVVLQARPQRLLRDEGDIDVLPQAEPCGGLSQPARGAEVRDGVENPCRAEEVAAFVVC